MSSTIHIQVPVTRQLEAEAATDPEIQREISLNADIGSLGTQKEHSISAHEQHAVSPKVSLRARGSRTGAALRNSSFCTEASDGSAFERVPSELRARRGREPEDVMPTSGRLALHVSSVAARHPCKLFCGCWSVVLGLTLAGVLSGELAFSEEGNKDWQVLDNVHSEAADAIQLAEAAVDCRPLNGTCPELPIRSQFNKGALGFSLIYEATGGTMFTPERLQQACVVERLFLQNEHYPKFCTLRPGARENLTVEGRSPMASDCQAQSSSVVQLFYGTGSVVECELLSEENVSAIKQDLLAGLQDPVQKLQIGFFVGADAAGQPYLHRSRSLLGLGYPLEGHEDEPPTSNVLRAATREFWEQLEQDMLEHFGKQHSLTQTAYWEQWQVGDVEVLFLSMSLGDLEKERVVSSDMSWLLLSMILVWMCLVWRTTSLFVGSVSLLQILFSIPVAFSVYRFVLNISYFQQLHGILIFIMLGVGSDDVFVFSDAWQQSEELVSNADHPSDDANDKATKDLTARLALAYQRAMVSVFNTSFTTAVAFLATAISPIIPIRTMGIFACLLVLTNYVFVITLTPAAFSVWQSYDMNISRCCRCCCPRRQAPAVAESVARGGSDQPAAVESSRAPSMLERWFLPIFEKPSIAVASLLLFALWGGLNCYWAAQLEPPHKMFQFFGEEHMHSRVQDTSATGFVAGSDDDYLVLQISFGIEGVDRSPNSTVSLDPWAPDLFYGVEVFDGRFDLGQPSAQAFLRGFCDRMRSVPCSSKGCANGLLVQPDPRAVSCFIEDFDEWTGGLAYEGEEFTSRLRTFRDEQQPQRILNNQATWEKSIGFVDGQLRYVEIQAMLTLKKTQPASVRAEVLDVVEHFLQQEQAAAPEAIGRILQTVGFDWILLVLEQELVGGLFNGFAICFPTAFVVLLLATQNVLVAVYAVVTIGAIVMSVLGWCWAAEGWYLGVAESIAGIIVIGLAVDYVIHLGHMYLEVGHLGYETRAERWRMAFKNMGATVLAGAVTTLVAGLSMRFCQMTFFLQMSTLISVTIVYSLLFTLFFFMCLLRVVGPDGRFGDISGLLRHDRWCPKRHVGSSSEVPAAPGIA
mmetsp:Transcript_73571/g.185940  ORF Transcript_73571/g.185940 Transcript_73571/m.185940 type:complete len:1090 (+) Transcript_73571:76-3345(+)